MVILERDRFHNKFHQFQPENWFTEAIAFWSTENGKYWFEIRRSLKFCRQEWLRATTLTLYPADPSHPTSVVTYQTP